MKHLFGLLALLVIMMGCQQATSTSSADGEGYADLSEISVLVYTYTAGWRHDSIPTGVATFWEMAEEHEFQITATERSAYFRDENLTNYDVVVFLNTTENVLEGAQQEAFKSFIQQGGGFVGIHSAADSEYEWEWYGNLVGGYFDGHPPVQEAELHRLDDSHPSTAHLPEVWTHTDEWYSYRDLYEGINVLLNLDESTFDLGDTPAMGNDHPIAWYHEYDGGRAWYTGLGHTHEAYEDENFRRHLIGGIAWASGVE